MIFWIATSIIIIAWVVFIIYCASDDGYGFDGYGLFIGLFPGALVAGAAWLLFCVILISGGGQAAQPYTVASESKTSLAALNTGNETSGRFFLGSGYVNSEPVFSYVTVNDNDGFELRQVDADDSVVYEFEDGSDKKPYVTEYVWHNQNPDWVSPLNPFTHEYSTYEFYVPEGSVLTGSYNVQP